MGSNAHSPIIIEIVLVILKTTMYMRPMRQIVNIQWCVYFLLYFCNIDKVSSPPPHLQPSDLKRIESLIDGVYIRRTAVYIYEYIA